MNNDELARIDAEAAEWARRMDHPRRASVGATVYREACARLIRERDEAEDEIIRLMDVVEDQYRRIRKLEEALDGPTMRLSQFCEAMETWMDAIKRNNTDPALIGDDKPEHLHGAEYHEVLDRIRLDIRKSSLLARLLYDGEPLRTEMCPTHKGHWSGLFIDCPHGCEGEGWLPPGRDAGFVQRDYALEPLEEDGS